MKVVPQAFYENPNIRKILADGLSCVIQKRVDSPDLNNERYASAHALTVVLRGQLKIEPFERAAFMVSPGQMVFLPKGLYLISDLLPKGQSFEALVFFFEERLITDFLRQVEIRSAEIPISIPLVMTYSSRVRQYADNLCVLYGGQVSAHKKVTEIKLLELLHLLSQSEDGARFLRQLQALQHKARRNIKDFMAINFDKPLAIEDYAYLTGRSLSTFRRDFKRQFEMAPKQWLIDRRLEKARELLTTTHTNVTQAAFAVGYEDLSHFIKAFQKKYSISPKQWVMENRREMEV